MQTARSGRPPAGVAGGDTGLATGRKGAATLELGCLFRERGRQAGGVRSGRWHPCELIGKERGLLNTRVRRRGGQRDAPSREAPWPQGRWRRTNGRGSRQSPRGQTRGGSGWSPAFQAWAERRPPSPQGKLRPQHMLSGCYTGPGAGELGGDFPGKGQMVISQALQVAHNYSTLLSRGKAAVDTMFFHNAFPLKIIYKNTRRATFGPGP